MKVICAIAVQVPVHRMRVTVRCRELGTSLHRMVRRLIESGADDDGQIAALLGLPQQRIREVRGELERRLALTEREYLMWVDQARGRCLPYSALADEECAITCDPMGLTLPLEPPTAATLAGMGLSAAASWEAGVLQGHVEIEEICDVTADRRGRTPSGNDGLSHVLRLPDVHLVVSADDEGGPPHVSLAQHAIESPKLTAWLHDTYGERLTTDVIDLARVRVTPPSWDADLGCSPNWEQLEPAPRVVRESIVQRRRQRRGSGGRLRPGPQRHPRMAGGCVATRR